MKKARNGFIKTFPYLCLVGVIALGLITTLATGGGGGGECDLPGPTSLTESILDYEISFSWSAVENADAYHIRIGTQANLTEIPPGDSCPGGSLEINPACIESWSSEPSIIFFKEQLFGASRGTYYWAVVPVCENGVRGNWSSTKSFVYTDPSDTSCCPHPEDGEDSISINTFLSWCRSETTLLGDWTYEIYLGTSSDPPLVKSNHESLFYFPDQLNDDTTYYWKIIARNNLGLTEEGPLWQFHTHEEQGNSRPDTPSDPQPEDGAVNVVPLTLNWNCSDPDGDNITYHLYWGLTEALSNYVCDIETSTYPFLSLVCSYRHYWKIIAEDEHGAAIEGPLWYFDAAICGDTGQCEPSNPTPSDGATDVDPIEVNLTWECKDHDGDGITYQVCWGKEESPCSEHRSEILNTNSYQLSNLQEGTRYYWKVFAIDENKDTTDGALWSFVTAGFSVPIHTTVITRYDGYSTDLLYATARSESWNEYVNDTGVDEICPQESCLGIEVGQIAIAGVYAFVDLVPIQFGWIVENHGSSTKGEYSLTSKAGYSEASLVIDHLDCFSGPPYFNNDIFMIEFFIDGVKVADQPCQNDMNDCSFKKITIPLPFDSVKTGSEIPVEFRSNRVKQVNPVPLFEPEDFPHYCFEVIGGIPRIVLE